MKRMVQWGLVVVFLFSVLNLALANDEAQIKELIKAYNNGQEITKEQFKLIEPYLKQPKKKLIYSSKGPLNEGFEGGAIPADWTVYDNDGDGNEWYAYNNSTYAHSGNYSAAVAWNASGNDDWLITPQLDVTAANHTFSFWARSRSSYYLEDMDVKLSTTGNNISDFTVSLDHVTGVPTTYTQYTYDLSAYIGQQIYIAIVCVSVDKYYLYVDDVTGPNIYVTTPPNPATNPSPSDGATDVSIYTTLNWSSGGGAPTGYKIYFGTDGGGVTSPTNIENGTDLGNTTTYDPTPDLAYSTTYYWQIVPYNDNGDATGCPIWSFTTEADPNYGGGGDDNGGYYFANSLATNAPSHPYFSWVDISSTGTDIIGDLGDESVGGPYNIGFTFNFFGNDYTQLYISSNGWISFDSQSSAYYSNTTIPNASSPNNIIALFWDDLNPASSSVTDKHLYIGNAPNGDYVISLVNYPEYGADADGWITCQAILKQNGNIKFQYYEHGSSIDLNGATVGIENSDGTAGVQYRYNTSGGPLFGSPLAVEFGMDDQSLPVELNSFIAQAGNNRAFLKWTTQSEVNNLGFEIYRSTSESGEYQMIASYENYDNLRGAGNSNTTHTYAFTDANVLNGITYYYKLADVSMNGQKHFHGPVSVIPNKNGADLKNTGLIPKTFALKNNFPNPFNPTTTIGFDIPMVPGGKIHVDLSIYNMLGQKVRTLVSDVLTPGSYQITWDGRNENGAIVANGIYFYGIRTEKFTRFKKMILMK